MASIRPPSGSPSSTGRWADRRPKGALLVALGGIGIGIVAWAQAIHAHRPRVEDRGDASRPPRRRSAAFVADFDGAARRSSDGGSSSSDDRRRRRAGLAALFPIRSLGPGPGRGLKNTPSGERAPPRHRGGRAGRGRGARRRRHHRLPGGHLGADDAPTVLIRLGPDRSTPSRPRGLGPVGTSSPTRSCAPTGCPVGLYQEERVLLCPCHQSTFDVPNGCRPIFGPAARPAPAAARRRRRRVPHRPGATSPIRSAPASGTGGMTHRGRAAGAGPMGRQQTRRRTPSSAPPSTRSSPTTGPSCSARSPSTRSWSWWRPASTSPSSSTRAPPETYEGSYAPLRGVEVSQAFDSRSSSASTCGPASSCARCITGQH